MLRVITLQPLHVLRSKHKYGQDVPLKIWNVQQVLNITCDSLCNRIVQAKSLYTVFHLTILSSPITSFYRHFFFNLRCNTLLLPTSSVCHLATRNTSWERQRERDVLLSLFQVKLHVGYIPTAKSISNGSEKASQHIIVCFFYHANSKLNQLLFTHFEKKKKFCTNKYLPHYCTNSAMTK